MREDFNLQPPQSKSRLIEDAADHGNGPEVRFIKNASSEIPDKPLLRARQ